MLQKRPFLALVHFTILLLSSDFLQAQDKTASGVVTSYSVLLSEFSGYNSGGYYFTLYSSTYDGITNAFPQGLSNDQLSYELMPSTPGSGSYLTDFAAYSSTYGVYYNRGTITVTLPTTDSDGNGCPDALQVNKSFSNTGSATSTQYVSQDGGFTWSNYGSTSASFTFNRNAGSAFGTVSGSEYSSPDGTTSTYTGSYSVQGGTGNATYNTTTKGIIFAGNSFSFDTSGTGTSTYTRISNDQVSVAQFNFYTTDGYTRTVKAFTLNRAGNYYRAYPVELVDGDPSTSFVDFKYCHLEIYDSNDSDSDGIPDLSDATPEPIPTITSPTTASGTVGGSVTYQATATGNPTRYNLSGTLPTGLTFNSSTGRITGNPTQSGVFTVSLSATSGSYTGPSVSLRITIPALVGPFPLGGGSTSGDDDYSPAFASSLAFDGNSATTWHSKGGSFPKVLGYDFGSARTVSSISLNQGWPGSNTFHATAVEVLGSNDNSSWTSLQTFSSLSFGLNNLTLSSPASYRYYVLKATAGPTSWWCVREATF